MSRASRLLAFFPVLAGLLAAGCVSLPKQTLELNTLLGNQIAESKRMNLEVIEAWAEQSRGRVETLLHYHIVPQFIIKFLEDPTTKEDLDNIVCSDKGKLDRAMVIQDMVEAISKQIQRIRDQLFGEVNTQHKALAAAANDHYANMERMHRSIQANINSVVKGQDFEKQIREALSRPINQVVPLDKAREKLDKALAPFIKEE